MGITNSALYKFNNLLQEDLDLNDYSDGYVLMRDGKSIDVFNNYLDANNSLLYSRMGDIEYNLGQHSYEIKQWINGELIDLNEDIEEDWNQPKEGFAGWVAIYQGNRIEIPKDEANSLYDAKLKAIEKLNVPKSKLGLLVIQPGYDEYKENYIPSNTNDDEIKYRDVDGVLGPVNIKYTKEQLKLLYDDLKDDDPVVSHYNSFEEWFKDTVDNYLEEVK